MGASMKILLIAVMLVHSWYNEKCCHDKDCHPVPFEEIEKISDGWLWRDAATKQRYWFSHDRLRTSHDDACHVCISPMTIPSGICLYLPLRLNQKAPIEELGRVPRAS